jgi:hypothetical protein
MNAIEFQSAYCSLVVVVVVVVVAAVQTICPSWR